MITGTVNILKPNKKNIGPAKNRVSGMLREKQPFTGRVATICDNHNYRVLVNSNAWFCGLNTRFALITSYVSEPVCFY